MPDLTSEAIYLNIEAAEIIVLPPIKYKVFELPPEIGPVYMYITAAAIKLIILFACEAKDSICARTSENSGLE